MLIVKEATTQAFAFATLVMLEILTKKVAKFMVSKFKQVTKVNFNMIIRYLLFMTHVA